MKKRDLSEERRLLADYEKEELRTVSPSKADFEKYRAAARATFVQDRRVNVSLTSPDLMDLQARAAAEGVPYQTFIASVLHKFVSGRLVEKPPRRTSQVNRKANGRARRSR